MTLAANFLHSILTLPFPDAENAQFKSKVERWRTARTSNPVVAQTSASRESVLNASSLPVKVSCVIMGADWHTVEVAVRMDGFRLDSAWRHARWRHFHCCAVLQYSAVLMAVQQEALRRLT